MLTEGQKHRIFVLLERGYKISKIMREMKLSRPVVERQKRIWSLRRQAKEQLGIDIGVKREVALERTDDFIRMLRGICKRLEVVGSVRRKKEYVKDIDIVCIPDCDLNKKLRDFAVMDKNTELIANGKKLIRVKYNDIQVDIYVCDEKNYEVIRLIRTGSENFNVKLCSKAKRKGGVLHADGRGLFDSDGKLISNTEEGIIKALMGRYIHPKNRD